MTGQRTQLAGRSVQDLFWIGIRPRTLTMAAVPVVVGAVLAWSRDAAVLELTFAMTLACAVLIQVGTNLFNDASDGERGADGADRIGPQRLTGAGLASAKQVRAAAIASFAAAFVAGVYLVAVGGLVILSIGIASLVAGYLYSSGPWPISHGPWGEAYVIAFFGVVAVAGSYYLQIGLLPDWRIMVTGAAIGAPAAAVLLVNNLRDLEPDRRAGRRTLASRLGPKAARWAYAGLMLAPFPMLGIALGWRGVGAAWAALPLCAWIAVTGFRTPAGAAMNAQLGRTALAQVLLGALLVLALLR